MSDEPKTNEIVRRVKVSIPKLIQDNPMVKWTTADGKWSQSTPIDSNIVRLLSGLLDAYYELKMNKEQILDMRQITEKEYLADAPQ